MADVPLFTVLPPLRCCEPGLDSGLGICGELAAWQRPSLVTAGSSYFCDEHRLPADVPIAGELLVRQVRITIEAIFAGTSSTPGLARQEAFDRLERAVQEVGGVVSMQAATDVVGRYVPPAASQRPRVTGPRVQ